MSSTASTPPDVDPAATARGHTAFVGFYVLVMLVFYRVGVIGVTGIPLQFVLMNTLGLKPQAQATFVFLSDIPFFVGFIFGFIRDRWRPLNMGDRGYFLILPPLLAAADLWLGLGPFSYARLISGVVFIAIISAWLGAAAHGLLTVIARYHGMAGRLSVALLVTPRLIGIIANAVGGHLSTAAHQHQAFLYSAVLCLPMMGLAFWKPKAAYVHEEDGRPGVRAVPEGIGQALRRLAAHRVVYLPAVIMFLWAFAPGWGTPLLFYLTKKVGLSEAVYGNVNALIGVGVLISTLAYGVLCLRLRLRRLLYIGTFLGVLGCPIFLLIHNAAQAYVIALLAGASLSIALCAYNDLLIRSCPRKLEGAAFLFVGAMSAIAADTSDIFGSWLYEKGGFGLALGVSTACTALVLAVLPFVPKRLTAPPEGVRLDSSGPVTAPATVAAPAEA